MRSFFVTFSGISPEPLPWILSDAPSTWLNGRFSVTGSATTYTGQCDEVTGPWDLQIYVRVKDTGTGNASSHLCTNVADNLTELLQSSEVHELTNAGFTNLTILSGPVPLSAAGWQMCMFTVRGTIVYYVPRG